jgi:predicted CoA-binding protein
MRAGDVAVPLVGSYCRPMTAEQVLRSARTVLLIDFPSRDVPDALARAGLSVMAQGGPGPEDFFSYQLDCEEVREVRTGGPPTGADVVYVHRPEDELPSILADARDLGASAVWCENGSDRAREVVEAAGLIYVDGSSIVDVARTLYEDR